MKGDLMELERDGSGDEPECEAVELSEAEDALADEFLELARAGARPDPGQYLSRLPGSEARLRPILGVCRRTHDEDDLVGEYCRKNTISAPKVGAEALKAGSGVA
jgi:hypothetical protein